MHSGRVCEITNGSFVEAKQEKRWLAVRPLWSNPDDRIGSGSDGRPLGLTSGKLTSEVRCLEAVTRERVSSTEAV